MVVGPYADDAVLFAQQLHDLRIGSDLGAVGPGVEDVRRREPEGVHRAVRNPHGADQRRVGRRFQPQRLPGVDNVGPDAGAAAGIHENGLIFQSVLRQ